jgi:hypothetical protein
MELDAGTMRMLALMEQERQAEDGDAVMGDVASDEATADDPPAGLALL